VEHIGSLKGVQKLFDEIYSLSEGSDRICRLSYGYI